MNEEFDPVAASGESTYRAPRALELNEITINGDADVEETSPGQFTRKGGYFRKRILVGKRKDEKPAEEKLGERVGAVFLKIRRKLVQRSQGGQIVYSTSEHNGATDIVDLYDGAGKLVQSGSAKALREGFPGLRTVQIIYALLTDDVTKEPELVRITIKGASLGSDAKLADNNSFYQYLSSFGKDEHVWEYITELSAILEKGQKSYFCMDFSRGAKLEEKFLKLALDRMKEVHLKIVEIDRAREAKRGSDARPKLPEDNTEQSAHDPAIDEEASDQPNPDDIPF